jgi:hypothetical protein
MTDGHSSSILQRRGGVVPLAVRMTAAPDSQGLGDGREGTLPQGATDEQCVPRRTLAIPTPSSVLPATRYADGISAVFTPFGSVSCASILTSRFGPNRDRFVLRLPRCCSTRCCISRA